jgi:hypothetical protein
MSYRADVIGRQIRALRGGPSDNWGRIYALLVEARDLLDDSGWNEWLQRYSDLKPLADSHSRLRELIQSTMEKDRQQRASMPRSAEPVERKPPPPVPRPVKSSYADFAQGFATEDRGGRFAKIDPLINDVPPQPPNSPWHHDPVPDEPLINFAAASRVSGNEQPIAAPVAAPVIERAPREEEWLGDIDRLLEVIEKRDAEIARLKAELKSQSNAASPVSPSSTVADAAPVGGGKVEVLGPPSADFSSAQKED